MKLAALIGGMNKAIFAGAGAGYATYQAAEAQGASTSVSITVGIIAAVVIGGVTYWIPNATDPDAVDVKTLLARVEQALGVPQSARQPVDGTPGASAPPNV